jgi:putative ABC transport system substrate-binding protein
MREPFQQGLRELGYVEKQNIILHIRIGEGRQLYDFAAELVRLKVDVIVAPSLLAIDAAKTATETIPIVATFRDDPVRLGYVASLSRPGRNITGVNGMTLELGGKWLELVVDTIPSAKRVAVFFNRIAEDKFPLWKSLDSAARSLGVALKWLHAGDGSPGYLNENLRRSDWRQADAFIVLPGFSHARNVKDLADYGLKNRIPGIFSRPDLDLDQFGGLMAYGANRFEQSRRAAYVVDKILKGVKPAELPVELPKIFELIVNHKVANELGITLPPRMLAWADHVFR